MKEQEELLLAQVCTEREREWFIHACGERGFSGVMLPNNLALFGESQQGRFFAAPNFALDVGAGRSAAACGRCEPELLENCLRLSGKKSVTLAEEDMPEGWQILGKDTLFELPAGKLLPLPAKEESWEGLTLCTSSSPWSVAALLYADRGRQRQEDFYSELCTRLNHGTAQVWTLEQEGHICCTVGAYAIGNGQAYLSCGYTLPALRGHGIGGRLIVRMANQFSSQGFRVTLRAREERTHFYLRLGFVPAGRFIECSPNKKQE